MSTVTVGIGLLAGLALGTTQGCDNVGRVAEQCGLDVNCEAGGILEGNASISGIRSIDAFFGAVIDLNAKVGQVSGNIRAELDAIAVSLDLQPGASGAEIRSAMEARISGAVSGGLTIRAEPARCEASVEVMASAAAECDAEVDPGEVNFACEGSCEVEAGVAVDCGVEADLRCTASAPNVACSGSCTGTCQLNAGATCEGACRGGCEGTCSVQNADGTCNGRCDGECTGSCELEVGATCDGQCQGTCEYTPAEAMCEAGAEARCEAMAGGSVQCEAGCEGNAEPPSVSAECEATVNAKADASVECTPPSLTIDWNWSTAVEGNADAEAEFRAWINGFRGHYAALLAATAQGELLVDAAAGLAAAAEGAVSGAANDLEGGANIRAVIGARCALEQLPVAAETIGNASTELSASVGAAAEITSVFAR